MTYCCGILVGEGLVMFAGSAPDAGVDNVATSESCTRSADWLIDTLTWAFRRRLIGTR